MKINNALAAGVLLAVSLAALVTMAACTNRAIAVGAQSAAQVVSSGRRATLFKDARGELALARAQGKQHVLMIVAAANGKAPAVAERVRTSGGSVRFIDEDVDYLRVRVPIEAVDRLLDDEDTVSVELSTDAQLRAYDLVNGWAGLGLEQARGRVQANTRAVPPPAGKAAAVHESSCSDPELPLTQPYSPLAGMGGTNFRAEHSSFDGRGVTIALLDGNPDLLLPELQDAVTLDGRSIAKLADVSTATDPEDDPSGGRSWIRTEAIDVARGRSFAYRDSTYAAPRSGAFRVGFFDETRFASAIADDINRDGNPAGSSRLFAVLWAADTNEVWVDANQNHRFDDERAMTDYRVRGDVGVFGTDDPATPERESIAFTVQTRPGTDWVAVHPAYDKHATNVIGAAVASRGSTGRFEGIAPGSRLVSIHHGSAGYAHAEALIRAVKDPLVDIVVLEQHSAVDDAYVLRDGRLVVTLVLERLIQKFQKPVLLPASNMAALSAVTEIGQARGAIAVGGHQARTSFQVNRGLAVEHEDNLHAASSFGPAGDGGLKPDVIAPSDVLSTAIGYMPSRPFGAGGCRRLPPGYTISNGTSTSGPVAAGAVALLISAAKQSGVQYDAARIKHALTMSGRYMPHIPAHMQGNGVVDVAGAWQLLQALDGKELPPRIENRAPVHTTLSHLLPVAHEGSGLFEIGTWRAGDRQERILTLTRTSGPSQPQTYGLSLQGNDGTFSAPAAVVLPLGTPVAVPVKIAPTSAGVHSALLTFDHPSVPGHAYRSLLTVLAAHALAVDNDYAFSDTLRLHQAGGNANRYVHVPEETSELNIGLNVSAGDAVINVKTPDGRYRGWGGLVRATGHAEEFVIRAPQAGVWEIMVRPGPGTTNAAIPERGPAPFTAAQLRVTGRVGGQKSTEEAGHAIARGEQHVYVLDVPPGTHNLHAQLYASTGDSSRTDLDLYAFDCTSGKCEPAQSDARIGNDETIDLAEPAAGRWKIVVDAFRVDGDRERYGLRTTPASGASIGRWGVDLSGADSSVHPGDNFYLHGNGAWLEANAIPADRTSWGTMAILRAEAETRVHDIVKGLAASQTVSDSVEGKVRDYYRAYMDEAGIESMGLQPVQKDLARIAAVRDRTELMRIAADPTFVTRLPIVAAIILDQKDPDRYVVAVTHGRLGLPEREYYLSPDARFAQIRDEYTAHIERTLTLANQRDAAAKARRIIALETEIAKLHWKNTDRRDRERTYNRRTREQVIDLLDGYPMQALLEARGLSRQSSMIVRELDAMPQLAALYRSTSLATWKEYMTFACISGQASLLPKALADEHFEFFGRILSGQPQQRDRWKRAVAALNADLPDAVGAMYAARYFDADSKAKMVELVENLRRAYGQRIDASSWMSQQTKIAAREKLASFRVKVGYPDTWRDYGDLDVRPDDPIGNMRRAADFKYRRDLARIDQATDREEWAMPPQTVNAYYNPVFNEIVFPAAILQPPFFDAAADPAVNYGAIGAVIGHEMAHGFDDQGSKSDARGVLRPWWSAYDVAAFQQLTDRLVAQYDGFEALPGLRVNGRLTVGENIGDSSGLSVALAAYRLSLAGKEASVLDGYSGDQRFFLAFAQVWRTQQRDEALRNQVMTDPHSPPEFRVNGAVRNLDPWYEAFGVREGHKLYLPPEQRVTIW